MKVMLFITGLGMGGAEKVVCELADKLYESGQEVSIVYFTGEILRRPENKEITLHKIALNFNLSIFNALISLVELVDEKQPDVIHSHMFHANIMARSIKLFRKNIRIICSSHSNYEGGRLRMAMYALTENLCDVHTNVSNNAAKALMKAGAVRNRKIITVYNGIDISKYKLDENLRSDARKKLNFNDGAKVILTIGRIDVPKDYPTLLKAFKIVREKQEHAFLLIVGDGPKRQEMEALSINLGINEHVKFLGIRNDVPELLNACDLFVSSSAWEGFGIAILEAMLCQRPIVATATDGAKELLKQKMVEVGDEKTLAQELLRVINGGGVASNYKNIEKFDWNEILKNWLFLYERSI